jgi:D-sedoheptulose 7-phosphate isomerase
MSQQRLLRLEEVNTTTNRYLDGLAEARDLLDIEGCERAISLVLDSLLSNSLVLTCGNGGSGSNASHFVNDWVKGVSNLVKSKPKAICLNDNIPSITAIANDSDFSHIFSSQLSNLGSPGDLLVAISGSGNSKNILAAINQAKRQGIKVVGVLGFDGGAALNLVDEAFWVPYNDMQIVEDLHSSFGHMVLKMAENYAH